MARKKTDPIEELKDSAERAWLAGLGALSQAEKQGDKLLKSLVKQGKKYESSLPSAEEIRETIAGYTKQAGEAFQGVESSLDKRIRQALKRAGVASQSEVDALKKEVARLKKARAAGGKKKAAKKKTSRKKPAAKAAARKKPAQPKTKAARS